MDRGLRHRLVALAALTLLAVGCSVDTDQFVASNAAPTETSDDSENAADSSFEPLAGTSPDELAFVEGGSPLDSAGPSERAQTNSTQDSDAGDAATIPVDADSVSAGQSDESFTDEPSTGEPSTDERSPLDQPSGYSSGNLDDGSPANTEEPEGLLGPSTTGTADSTGSADPGELTEAAARGAILTEAFGLPGARLLSDEHRQCVLAEFEAVGGTVRTDQIIASFAAAPSDVDVLINALVVCDALSYIENGLDDSLAAVLEGDMAGEVSDCLAETYGAPTELAALLKLALTEAEGASDAARQDGLSSVVVCAGLGDLVAADTIGLTNDTRSCLNSVGGGVMTALLNSEVRTSPANLDATEIGSLLASCLSATELDAVAD